MERWLSPVMKELATTNRLSDCRFIIEAPDGSKKTFECHKLMFCCASIAFERMFYGDFKESDTNEIVLKNVRPDVFAKFRDYIYTYNLNLLYEYDETTLIDLAKFAQQYLVISVTKECCDILCDRTDTADIAVLIQLYQFGNDIFHIDIVQEAWDNITCRFPKSMNHGAVYQLSSDAFFKYMVMSRKKLKAAMRFKMIETYLKFNNYKMGDVPTTPNEDTIVDAGTDQKGLKNSVKQMCCQYYPFFEPFYAYFDTIEEDDKESVKNERQKSIKNRKRKEYVQCKNVKNPYIKHLLEQIDFKHMTPQEFFDGPGKSKFFDMQEKYYMLYTTTIPKEKPFYIKNISKTN